MSWLYSRALVEEYLEANSLDGEQFAPSSGTPTPQAYLCNGKTTAAWKRFPSGMTSNFLTDDRGEALLKWYREGFLAPTSALPDEEQGSTDRQALCGNTWRELSVRFDRNTSSWKTVQCLFDEDLPESSVTLPRWGMMRGGELWERTMSALPTGETESGLWPTPRSSPAMSSGTVGQILRTVAKRGYRRQLEEAVVLWRTPSARDWKNARNPAKLAANGGTRQTGLKEQVCNKDGLTVAERNGQLNPDWTEWLMGFPIGFTASAPLETPKFRQWCDSHGICLEGQSDET
jgi:hypothetical protein